MSFKVYYTWCKVEVPCLAEKEVVSATWEDLEKQAEVKMEKQSIPAQGVERMGELEMSGLRSKMEEKG